MDSVERDQREKDKMGERGEKLFKRNPKDDHTKEKKKKLRKDDKQSVKKDVEQKPDKRYE